MKRASHSSVKDWNVCQALWFGRRNGNWNGEHNDTIAMDNGTTIHSLLSGYHRNGILDLGHPAISQFIYEKLGEYTELVEIEEGDQPDYYFKIEHKSIPIPTVGFFDLLRRSGSIFEYKSTKYPYIWSQKRVDTEQQATIYWWAYWTIFRKPPKDFTYFIIPTNGYGTIQKYITSRTLSDVQDIIPIVAKCVEEEGWASKNGLYIPECLVKNKAKDCYYPEECWKLLTKNGSSLWIPSGENLPKNPVKEKENERI